MTGHTGPVLALAAIPDRGWLASGSSDCSVRTSLWNDAVLGMKATVDATNSKLIELNSKAISN